MIRKNIKNAGLKLTPQRIAIYEALALLGHASAEEIIHKVQEKAPYISPATIYNTLDRFVQDKLISKLMTCSSRMLFDITTTPHLHLCATDGSVIRDLDDMGLQLMIKEYVSGLSIPDFTLKDIKINIVGNFHSTK